MKHFVEHLAVMLRVLPQFNKPEIKSMDLEFGSSIPCAPLLPSTLLTSLAPQSITRVCKLDGLFIDTQGAAALSPRRAAPCCRGDHPAAHLAHCLARPFPRAPLSLLEETTPAPSRPRRALARARAHAAMAERHCRPDNPVHPSPARRRPATTRAPRNL